MYSKLLVLLAVTLTSVLVNTQQHSPCKLANGQDGSCQLFKNCKGAISQFILGIQPLMCGDIQHICCAIERDIESSVESSSSEDVVGRSSKMLISQNCYSGRTADSELIYSTTDDAVADKEIREHENNFLVKIGIRKVNGDIHFFCGGILIKPQFVLTPAHCTDYKGRAPEVVQIGSPNSNAYEDYAENVPISKIHLHPGYSKQTMYNDIALLELPISSNLIPVCMGTLDVKDTGKVATFALGQDLHSGSQVQSMSVDIISNEYCNEVYTSMRKIPHGVLDSQFCVGNSNITEAAMCRQYTGGPLLAKEANGEFYLIGLANYVHMCYSTIYPIIYTKITPHKQWLESIFN